jgi:hypothetical protein
MNAGNCCHPENPGSTHWTGCECHEARWAEKLAASEERAQRLEEALRNIEEETTDRFAEDIARAALAPPPEAEKKGGE